MTIDIKHISARFSSCPQLTVEQASEAIEAGFRTIINCRPDGEGGAEQPSSEDIRQIVEAHGGKYVHIPVVPGQLTQAQVDELAGVLPELPVPILGFCKGGTRAANLYQHALVKLEQ